MLLPELQTMAASLGISGTARMRKGELIAAIQERSDGRVPGPRSTAVDAAADAPTRARTSARERTDIAGSNGSFGGSGESAVKTAEPVLTAVEPAARPADAVTQEAVTQPAERERSQPAEGSERQGGESDRARSGSRRDNGRRDGSASDRQDFDGRSDRDPRGNDRGDRDQRGQRNERDNRGDRDQRGNDRNDRDQRGDQRNDRGQRSGDDQRDNDDDDGSRRSRRSRFRERNRRGRERGEGGGSGSSSGEPQANDDDVLVPVAGIVDVLDNYAFVRTSGYLSGPNDVYVSMAQIKRYGLRRGDAVTGAVRSVREGGEGRRDKYNPLIRLDSINGMDVEESRRRPEFYKLTPLYPQDRLRLETEAHVLTTRVIDLVMPIGKGQRALIVSPPKAGKTMVLQAIANAITRNNPECHLMVVLVDERPEEVTDMQRSVKGEVIASTFDRPPSDHTTVAELSIERAKRLVELGHDVVVLLDSITRLGRAYNNASPASGRILSGGIDSTALYPPKRFLGAARNIEHGGSLTIIATALVETGSTGDTVIFEEFKGTGNSELRLDRKIADKRVFPAIDIDPSGTRKEEILLAPDELAIVLKLRKVLHALDSQQAIDLLLDRLKKTRTNIEFLMQIAQSTPGE
jgi:transcription termination factor Rho